MGNEKENSRIEEEGFHVNLLLSKSIPVGGKRTLVQEEEESTIHSHLTRVAWLTKYHPSRTPRSNNTRFISRHTFTLLAYPSSRTPVPLSLLPRDSPTAWVRSAPPLFDLVPILDVESKKSTHPVCLHSCAVIRLRVVRKGGGSFFSFSRLGGRMDGVGMERVVHEGDVDSSEKETRRKRKGARLTSVLVMAWRIGRDWIEPTRNTSGLNERGWATEMAEVGQRETASAALGVGVGWLSGARVVG